MRDDQPGPPSDDIPDQIMKLAALRDDGILSNEEFESKKSELLAQMTATAAAQPSGDGAPQAAPPYGAVSPMPPVTPQKRKTTPAAWAGCGVLVLVALIIVVATAVGASNRARERAKSPAATPSVTRATQAAATSPTPSFEEVKAVAKTIPYDQLSKDAVSLTGQYVYYDAKIFQFDSNTGPNSFLAEIEKGKFDIWDGLVMVSAPKGAPGADKDDVVHLWARVEGATSYTTSLGASRSVPKLTAVQIELVQKG